MKRCVVIWAPEFDEPGKEGIEAAQSIAEDIKGALSKVPAELIKQGIDPAVVNATREYLAGLRYLVRKVEL